MSIEQWITRAWYQNQSWIRALSPLSTLYEIGLARRRNKALSLGRELPVPVVIVGNITVGGTGKTPLIIYLCQKLAAQGYRVGVVSRGYGAKTKDYPYKLSSTDQAQQVGDEPRLIHEQTGATLVIDPDRYAAARHLISQDRVDVILSDDGMQHFGLPRDMEILVVDAERELGNELMLPAGPLREPLERLLSVDFCLINGSVERLKSAALIHVVSGSFLVKPINWHQVATGNTLPLEALPVVQKRTAIAAIGNPQRFFNSLEKLGIQADCIALDDHQSISPESLSALSGGPDNKQVLMTMKDAVKCRSFANEHCWALDVGVQIDSALEARMLDKIQQLINNSAVKQQETSA